jgi:hypothetical protein
MGMKNKIIKCHQKYSKKDILMIAEEQIQFSLCMELVDRLNEVKAIKYSFVPDKDGENTIVTATIEIATWI